MSNYNETSHYHMFLDYFGKHHSFQTFDDKGLNKRLIKQLHGSLKLHFNELAELNSKGAGIYFTVNETNGLGRTTKNIVKIRSVFIDLDGTPLPESFGIPPSMIVNTSPKKYHCYWLVKDMPLESFTLYQQALATKFNSDPVVKDLPRIMRVAGFYHHKKQPYPVKILQCTTAEPYTMKEIKEGLELKRPEQKTIKMDYTPSTYKGKYTGTLRYGINAGERHAQLVKILVAIKKRGESFEYAKGEAIEFANSCVPPENLGEVMFQLKDIWRRY